MGAVGGGCEFYQHTVATARGRCLRCFTTAGTDQDTRGLARGDFIPVDGNGNEFAVSVDGESNWLEGIQLVALYVILGIAFFFV